MFTQTAIAAALTTMGMKNDPSMSAAAIYALVESYTSSTVKKGVDIVTVMKIVTRVNEIMMPHDNDVLELKAFINEALSVDSVAHTDEEIEDIVSSLGYLASRANSSMKSLDSMRQILNHLDAFSPHQSIIDSTLSNQVNKFNEFRLMVIELSNICYSRYQAIRMTSDEVAEMKRNKFKLALARAGENNKETLKALASK